MPLALPPGDTGSDTAVVPYRPPESSVAVRPTYGNRHDDFVDEEFDGITDAEIEAQERQMRKEEEQYNREMEDLQDKYDREQELKDKKLRSEEVDYASRQSKTDRKEQRKEELRVKREELKQKHADRLRAKKAQMATEAIETRARKQRERDEGRTVKDFRKMAQEQRGKKAPEPHMTLNMEGLKMYANKQGFGSKEQAKKTLTDAAGKAPAKTWEITKGVARGAAGMLIGNKKTVVTDGHGRSGKRATLAYRAANRSYNTEANKMRAQTKSIASVNAVMMFGRDTMPVRSRYKAGHEFGGKMVDPLARMSAVTLGGQREASPQPQPRSKKKDPLADFNRTLRGH